MKLKECLKENKKEIDREMERVFPKKMNREWIERAIGKTDFSFDEVSLNKALNEPIWEFLDRGGKRWRPLLMITSFRAFGGKEEELINKASVIPEFLHNGSIMVDDIEDDSDLRRGKKCTHKLYGVDIAVNAGNAMYFIPFILLYRNELNLSDEVKAKAYDLCIEEMLKIHFGQGTDIYWHQGKKGEVKEEHYLQMSAFKTGTLARLSAKLGALLAGAGKKEIEKIGAYAESIGIAFQIQDDILNLTGKEFAKGKGLGEDIHEGKRTLILIHALRKAKEKDRKRLLKIINSHPSDRKTIKEAIEIMKKTDSIEYAGEKARKLVEESWKELDALIPSSEAKEKLREFGEYLIKRKV
ncbi:polyprenyl synthetase family protein [Candidatus Micrarchaeota archaeon]|nr:polyprenyl synthetase family protein [Candidatus Micrarchaeota archaeon]